VGLSEIFGDYSQGDHAAMEIEIASVANFDRVLVDEDVSLHGTLLVEFLSGPVIGEFPIVQYGSLTGRFDEILVPALSPDDYSIDYGSGSNGVITLTSTVPEPSTLLLLCMGVVALLPCTRRKRTNERV